MIDSYRVDRSFSYAYDCMKDSLLVSFAHGYAKLMTESKCTLDSYAECLEF